MLYHALLLAALGLTGATPTARWHKESVGANYFMNNNFDGNQLIASYILPSGKLVAGAAVYTEGNGSASINDPAPFQNHPDPGLHAGSVVVVGKQVMVTNAGSNTFSVFDIDPADPARPTLKATYPSHGEFPNSIGATPDGKTACVLNIGAVNGFSCYAAAAGGWEHMPEWDRQFGLNLTTPPHGPIGNTPSALTFASDMSALHVAVKGRNPTDLNNPTGSFQPGAIYSYTINGTILADKPVITPAAIPFGLVEDQGAPGVFFTADPSTGYEVFNFARNMSVPGMIPNQRASCWSAQSKKTKSFFTVDAGGMSNITEIAVDPTTLKGTILASHSLGANATGTDVSIFSAAHHDWMYVNAAGFMSVHAFKITAPGKFSLFQRYHVSDMPKGTIPTMGFTGQAVFYK